jgi:hypothetical protein
VWAQVLGCEVNEKDVTRYELLKEAVISNDLMLDKLIIKVGVTTKLFFLPAAIFYV